MRRFNCGFLSTVSQLGEEWSVELGVDSTVCTYVSMDATEHGQSGWLIHLSEMFNILNGH